MRTKIVHFVIPITAFMACSLAAAGLSGCAALRHPTATADICSEAYRRGDYTTLINEAGRFERLTGGCQRAVMVALAEDDPERLLEVTTDTGDRNLIIAGALAAGVSRVDIDVPFRTRRVLRRSTDGRFLLEWLRTGELETIAVSSSLGKELAEARKQVARLLRDGVDEDELKPAVRMLAVITETATHDESVFGPTLPRVPVRPKTTTLRGLAVKLSLVPYLVETSAMSALTIIEMEPAGSRESDARFLGAVGDESTEG